LEVAPEREQGETDEHFANLTEHLKRMSAKPEPTNMVDFIQTSMQIHRECRES
jgi:hypothetical protein